MEVRDMMGSSVGLVVVTVTGKKACDDLISGRIFSSQINVKKKITGGGRCQVCVCALFAL